MKSFFAVCATALLASAEASEFKLRRRRRLEGIGGLFEWAGVFTVDPTYDHYWSMQKKSGAYADPKMGVVFIPIPYANSSTLHSQEDAAVALAGSAFSSCTTVATGTAAGDDANKMTIPTGGACFKLTPDQALSTSLFKIAKDAQITALWIGGQHVPTEFEDTAHYLFHSTGGTPSGGTRVDVEPVAQEQPGAFVRVTCQTANSYGAGVKIELKCDDSLCSTCNDTRIHTATQANPTPCWQEYHGTELEYIQVLCSADGTQANMSIFETKNGVAPTGCGAGQPEDIMERLYYASGTCNADAHGHHTHGDGTTTSAPTAATTTITSSASTTVPQLALVTILAAIGGVARWN
jgi:hypothetical protein